MAASLGHSALNHGAGMDCAAWLRSLGLGQYEAAFRENEIDDMVLRSPTAEDLKDLGVTIVGHRRCPIAALGAESQARAAPADIAATADNSAGDAADRRQVTVMFSDLVGATAAFAE